MAKQAPFVPLGTPLEKGCVDCGDGVLTLQLTPPTWDGDYAWLCSNYPGCDGKLSAHPNGRPMGFQADAVTRMWRHAYHEQQERLLASAPSPKRRAKKRFYSYVQHYLGRTGEEFHAGNFDLATARSVTEFLTRIEWSNIDNWYSETHPERVQPSSVPHDPSADTQPPDEGRP